MSRKRNAHVNVILITNIQQKILSGYFEGFIMNKYGSYNVLNNVFKYIYYDLTNARGLKIITLLFSWNFVTTFSPRPNVGSFICIQNFGITFKNKFEHMD